MLLLHGFASGRECLRSRVDALAPTRRVLLPHLPGYGGTAPHAQIVTGAGLLLLEEDRVETVAAVVGALAA